VTTAFEDRLAQAVAKRADGEDEEALALLVALQAEHPEDAEVNLQCAWAHDKLGLESEAVPYYERALELGLSEQSLHDALLGLGSTYRSLGRYDAALETLDRGVTAFPDDSAMRVFRAMALYNNGRHKEASETLLRLLIDTTADQAIIRYRGALDEYAADLNRTWA